MVKVYIGILIAFAIGAIAVSIIFSVVFKRQKHIDLVQGKLQNSDSSIANAISFLKLTNEWGLVDETR